MDETVNMKALSAHTAVRKLLDLLVQKGTLSRQEADQVLSESADTAQDQLPEIQNEGISS